MPNPSAYGDGSGLDDWPGSPEMAGGESIVVDLSSVP